MVNVSIAVATFNKLQTPVHCNNMCAYYMCMVNSRILSHGLNMYGFCACDLTVHVTLLHYAL